MTSCGIDLLSPYTMNMTYLSFLKITKENKSIILIFLQKIRDICCFFPNFRRGPEAYEKEADGKTNPGKNTIVCINAEGEI